MRALSPSIVAVSFALVACSSPDSGGNVAEGGTGGTGLGGASGGAGGASAGAGGVGGGGATSKGGASGKGGAGGTSAKGGAAGGVAGKGGGAGASGSASGAAGKGAGGGAGGASSMGAGGGDPNDPFAKARTLCVDTINKYRATINAPPLKRWTDNESCVDKEATGDGMANMPHVSFKNHLCSPGFAQDECPGYGPDPLAALPGCLDQMWAEKDRPVCKGCGTCDFPYQNCADCTFFGTNGTDGCGHYLNMKSTAFSQVACGFWTGGWYAQDFQ